MNKVYLDYAATTPTHKAVKEAMSPYFDEIFGNPSSAHHFGRSARKAVDASRETVAGLLGANPDEIIFTSGGTESDNFALEGIAYANKNKGRHIITSKIEHHAILHCCKFLSEQGFEITYLDVDKYGSVDPQRVKEAIKDSTILVSIMHANNEIGTIEPLKEISRITKEKGIYLHTDAVQTVGHIPVDVNDLGVDMLSLSAHKLYGPKGIGALFIKKGVKIVPYLHGGSQEKGLRASTENVPGIVGLAKACEIAKSSLHNESEELTILRDKLISEILKNIPDTYLNGHPANRLPNNVNISVDYVEGESILLNLDMLGIAVSTGSACASGSTQASHVLLAAGISPQLARGSIRFSMGSLTTKKEIEYVLEELPKIILKIRGISPLYRR